LEYNFREVGFLLISERFDDSEECLNRLAKPNMNEDVRMNEPENLEDRLPDMVQDFFRAEEGGAQNSMFADIEEDDAQWHKLKRKELQQLWLGVSTFDALSRRDFDLHAVLQEDIMLMQMMVNSLLGTFLALPGNMMEVPIFQMAILRGPVQYGWMYPHVDMSKGDISMVWYYVFPLFLLLALVILNEGGFPDVEKQHMFYISFDEIPNGVVQNVDIIDASVKQDYFEDEEDETGWQYASDNDESNTLNVSFIIIVEEMGLSLPAASLLLINPYGNNDNFFMLFKYGYGVGFMLLRIASSTTLNHGVAYFTIFTISGHVNEKYVLMKNSPHFVKKARIVIASSIKLLPIF
ncbi:hypothetical protein ACJX0J_033726, partial [Zea mays]